MSTITRIKEGINQLNQAAFQILCDELLSKNYSNIVSLGTKDGAEKTTPGTPDAYFPLRDKKYVFAEYTTQKKGLLAKIQSDIGKCLDERYVKIPLSSIDEIVYCHTSSNIKPADDYKLKAICTEKGIKLTLIGIDSLAEMLMKYPRLVKEHLCLNIDSAQIQSVDDFIRKYDASPVVAPLKTDFLFREKEIEEIFTAFKNVRTVGNPIF